MENPIEDMYEGQSVPELKRKKVGLISIDIQYHDAAIGYGFFKDAKREDHSYYFDRLDDVVFPTVNKLQELFRSEGLEVIHVRIEALTADGRDRSLEHKRIGCHVPKGSKAAEIMPQVAPKDDEIVLSKTASGVFNSTNLEYVLRNLGIDQLVTVGVLTNECIETAVRDGADKGFTMYIVDEGTAALTPELHESSMKVLNGVYGYRVSAEQIIDMVKNSK
ncbi:MULTISPECIES: cysteine hydrolase family protein [Flammeovirga]|uniref:Cysteine hydrolase n=1 Tax=Flammeovirga agarivorans TaxID=2726742 RepID=A0A7X8SNX1_9BACT|nr:MULTISPECIES: isochorismatase family cysteine hydrolase [Flammeovirga]NLR93577.1 cysteine hydrolase [Flammeovirga agarivorans]